MAVVGILCYAGACGRDCAFSVAWACMGYAVVFDGVTTLVSGGSSQAGAIPRLGQLES